MHADNGSSGSGKTETEFAGRIETRPSSGAAGEWQLGGRTVTVTAQTELRTENGPIAVGAIAEIKAILESDDSVTASRVRIQDSPAPSTSQPTPSPVTRPGTQPQIEGLKGLVEAAPTTGFIGDWKRAGRVVKVTAVTKIEQNFGSLAVGALAEVKGTALAGAIDAIRVEVVAPATASPKPALPAEVTGVSQSRPAVIRNGDWIVGGNTVRVIASTVINSQRGGPAVGATIEVRGTLGDAGVITAASIVVKAAAITATHMTLSTILGVVRSRPTENGKGEWRINCEIVHVHSSTTLASSNGSIGVGSVVQVNGWQDSEKTIHAESITARPEPPKSDPESRLARFFGRVTEDFGADFVKVEDRTVRLNSTALLDSD